MVVGKRRGDWGTKPIMLLRVGMWTWLMSTPAMDRVPWGTGYRPRIREAMVDFPEPETPTRAVEVEACRVRERDVRTGWEGREG